MDEKLSAMNLNETHKHLSKKSLTEIQYVDWSEDLQKCIQTDQV